MVDHHERLVSNFVF